MSEAPSTALPADRAFVVQFSTGTDLGRNRHEGRVEHVVSGLCAQFRTVDELMAFMTRTLAHRRPTSSDTEEATTS